MKFDFLVCGTSNDGFFGQMAFLRLCLDHLGGDYAAARMVAVFGDHASEEIPERWRPWFTNIEVVWAHPIGAENPWYRAQHDRRFGIIRPDADLAIICDADVALLAGFDQLAAELVAEPALGAVIAHYHAWCENGTGDPALDWNSLAAAVLGHPIPIEHRYTLMPGDTPPQAPFYFNYGVLIAPPALLARFHAEDSQLRDRVEATTGGWWGPQVSGALACASARLPTRALPMRYNFPNDAVADALYPEETGNIVFMHYLRTGQFDRQRIFADPAAFGEFMAMELAGSSRIFQQHVAAVTGGVYPFVEMAAAVG